MQGVSLIDTLIITVVSMVIVFIVLILISYAIGVLKNFSKEDQNKIDKNSLVESKELEEEVEDLMIEKKPIDNLEDDEELVAVIAAVIATNMGLNIPDIRIQRIRKINKSVWKDAARLEQMN